MLRRIWKDIESRGKKPVKRWLDGVDSEEEWVNMILTLTEDTT